MKTILNTHSKQLIAKSGLTILLMMAVVVKSYAHPVKIHRDTSISAEIKVQLGDFKSTGIFHFPHSVFRFYRFHNFQPVWIKSGEDPKRTWEGVLLINCVLQFGLCHADYHPQE